MGFWVSCINYLLMRLIVESIVYLGDYLFCRRKREDFHYGHRIISVTGGG